MKVMQVFITGSPLETARALDPKRLNRQIQETKVILAALNGAKAWSNHPCVLQYREHKEWLEEYLKCLVSYKNNDIVQSFVAEQWCHITKPKWHTQEYYEQMKRRLYTKDPEHYKQWAHLGKSQENWYFVDGEWRVYVNGKRVE